MSFVLIYKSLLKSNKGLISSLKSYALITNL